MNYLKKFIFILSLCINYNFSQIIKGICGIPNVPYKATLNPNKPFYFEEEEVSCECNNSNIDFLQTRKCQKGKWIEDQFICGM